MIREKLFSLLGDRPASKPEDVVKVCEMDKETFIVETVLLNLNEIERVPAYFIKPKKSKEKIPVVLYNHSHGGNYTLGKEEVLNGTHYLQPQSFAKTLTDLGYGVLAIDAWGFNERSGKKESELFKEMLVKGQVMWGMMIYDSIHALDYLNTRTDVDVKRLATIGMSMGGLMAWWLGALDERIKVTIDIAAQVDLETLIEQGLLDKHGFYSYVPNLLKHFSTSDIQQLILPRKRLSLVGKNDPLCPLQGVEKISKALQQTGQNDFKQVVTSGGHQETAYMRAMWIAYLKDHL
nr:prolyl oligopeptidase family serine peptidase [Marinilactibacillus kalidii]